MCEKGETEEDMNTSDQPILIINQILALAIIVALGIFLVP